MPPRSVTFVTLTTKPAPSSSNPEGRHPSPAAATQQPFGLRRHQQPPQPPLPKPRRQSTIINRSVNKGPDHLTPVSYAQQPRRRMRWRRGIDASRATPNGCVFVFLTINHLLLFFFSSFYFFFLFFVLPSTASLVGIRTRREE